MIVGGRFQLEGVLGAGATGEVSRARDQEAGGEVAVKLAGDWLPPDQARTQFQREAAALSVLVSPHVVRLIATGEVEDGRPYLVLELLDGRTLQEEVAAHGPVAPADLVDWMGQAAAALELAHGVGIIHRDLKPSNLFLHHDDGGRALKVLDFGLVKDVSELADETGDLLGTPLYMAPEQVRRQATRVGAETDIWAIGMIAVTLLTGEPYWTAPDVTGILAAIEGSPLAPPSQRWGWLPPAFDAWFARSTQRVPERRFRSAIDQAAALAVALRDAVAAPRMPAGVMGDASTLAAARTPTPILLHSMLPGGRPLIGRRVECAALEERLRAGALVTVTGPAGVGKTRVAEALTVALADAYPDGVWMVPLTAARAPAAAAEAIARALELEPDSTRGAVDRVAAALAPRRALLVIDGAEQVVDVAELIDELRGQAPHVAWLVTSRLPLGLDGEERVVLEPLEVPTSSPIAPDEAHSYDAVKLFARHAAARHHGFAVTRDNVADVVAICRLCDGLPLAIELAAARAAGRDLAELRARLEAAPEAPAGDGARDSVQAAVAWSYQQLDGDEQRVLRGLAVLPGGATFQGVRDWLGGDVGQLAAAVLRLVELNLLSRTAEEPPRLVMLDAVRELCRRLSAEAGEEDELWRLALAHLERLTARSEEELRGARQDEWLLRLDAERDNLRDGLERAIDDDPAAALRLAGRLVWFWYLRGHYQEGSRWVEAALAAAPEESSVHRLRALHGAGRLALLQCRYDRATAHLRACRDLAAEVGDPRATAEASQLLGSVARELGDYPAARRRHWRSLALWQELGDRREVARTRNYLAFLAWLSDPGGDPGGEDAVWRLGEAETELGQLGDHEGIVWCLLNRGAIAHYGGDRAAASAALGRAFAQSAAARFQEGIAWSLDLIGLGSLAAGEPVQARAQLHASLRVHRRLGDLWRCASVLDELAAVAVASDRPARAALFLGAADGLRERLGVPVPGCELRLHDQTIERGAAALGGAFISGRERGRRSPLDEVVVLAGEPM